MVRNKNSDVESIPSLDQDYEPQEVCDLRGGFVASSTTTLREFRDGRGRDYATDGSGSSRLVINDTTIKVTNANGIVTIPG